MGKKIEEKIEKALEKLDPNTQEYVQQTLEYMKSIVEQLGDMPTPNEDPNFYEALEALMNVIKEERLKLTMKDIAEYLGIDYAKLRKNRSLHRKEKAEYGLDETPTQQPQLPDAVMSEAPPKPQPMPAPPVRKTPQVTALHSATMRKAEKTMVSLVAKKVEDVIREEADLVFNIGKEFYLMWRAKCFSIGYENLLNCLHDGMKFFFDYKDMVEMLEQELEECKTSVKYLLATQKPEIRRAILLEKAKELVKEASRLPPSEQKMIVDKVLAILEKLVY